MPKTIQIRNLDDDVYANLQRQAGVEGITVPELLRRAATRMAGRPSTREWLDRVGKRSTGGTPTDTIEALDEIRGPWPDADR